MPNAPSFCRASPVPPAITPNHGAINRVLRISVSWHENTLRKHFCKIYWTSYQLLHVRLRTTVETVTISPWISLWSFYNGNQHLKSRKGDERVSSSTPHDPAPKKYAVNWGTGSHPDPRTRHVYHPKMVLSKFWSSDPDLLGTSCKLTPGF